MNAFFALALLSSLVQAVVELDDGDASITYTGLWNHDSQQEFGSNGTFSYSNDPSAQYSFSFEGTGFDVLYGTKSDRGKFLVYVNSILAGSGDGFEEGNTQGSSESTVRYSIKDLPAARHNVRIVHQGTEDERIASDGRFGRIGFICLDFLRIEDAPATTTMDTSSFSRSVAEAVATASEPAKGSDENEGSRTNIGAIVGGAVGGGIGLLALLLLVFCCLRRQKKKRNPTPVRSSLDSEMHEAPSRYEAPTRYDISPIPDSARHSAYSGYALNSPARPTSGYASSDAYARPDSTADVRTSLLSDNEEDLHLGRLPPAYAAASVEISGASSSSLSAPSAIPLPASSNTSSPVKGRLV